MVNISGIKGNVSPLQAESHCTTLSKTWESYVTAGERGDGVRMEAPQESGGCLVRVHCRAPSPTFLIYLALSFHNMVEYVYKGCSLHVFARDNKY